MSGCSVCANDDLYACASCPRLFCSEECYENDEHTKICAVDGVFDSLRGRSSFGKFFENYARIVLEYARVYVTFEYGKTPTDNLGYANLDKILQELRRALDNLGNQPEALKKSILQIRLNTKQFGEKALVANATELETLLYAANFGFMSAILDAIYQTDSSIPETKVKSFVSAVYALVLKAPETDTAKKMVDNMDAKIANDSVSVLKAFVSERVPKEKQLHRKEFVQIFKDLGVELDRRFALAFAK